MEQKARLLNFIFVPFKFFVCSFCHQNVRNRSRKKIFFEHFRKIFFRLFVSNLSSNWCRMKKKSGKTFQENYKNFDGKQLVPSVFKKISIDRFERMVKWRSEVKNLEIYVVTEGRRRCKKFWKPLLPTQYLNGINILQRLTEIQRKKF